MELASEEGVNIAHRSETSHGEALRCVGETVQTNRRRNAALPRATSRFGALCLLPPLTPTPSAGATPMSAAHAPVPPPHRSGGGGGLAAAGDGGAGGDDDGNDPSRLKRTHAVDADPAFSEEEEEEEEEKHGLDIPPDRLPPSDILRPPPHLSGSRRDAAPAIAPHQCHVRQVPARPHEISPGAEVARGRPAVYASGVRARGRGLVAPAIRRGDSAAEEVRLRGVQARVRHPAGTRRPPCEPQEPERLPRRSQGSNEGRLQAERATCRRCGGETSWAEDQAEGEEGAAEAPTASGGAVGGTSRGSKRRRREHRVDLNVPPVSSSDTGSASSSSAGNSAP
ncbi:hypothetical protein MUK42_08104 [Musa troglodytarum]|uniref:Uncharacterized protein n=1 Tax=Musa troglodytarum TaxID=320322 RepID=A0A9E7EEF2_9LILI|nr:hypothetical protein MUK42_08104 [Musa troglodytarum]